MRLTVIEVEDRVEKALERCFMMKARSAQRTATRTAAAKATPAKATTTRAAVARRQARAS